MVSKLDMMVPPQLNKDFIEPPLLNCVCACVYIEHLDQFLIFKINTFQVFIN
jgi:hypothetical protein